MNFPFVKSSGGDSMALATRLKQGTFLVVDDFDSMRKVTINQLKQLGATRIIEAMNGAEALKMLARHPVTMVLSDWNMPVMSGLELLLSIRANEKLFALPFLMITAEAERDRVMMAIQSGVSELLVKPYTSGRFGERVEKTLDWKPRQNKPIDPAAVLAGTGARVSLNGTPLTTETESVARDAPAELAAQATAPAQRVAPGVERVRERPTILVVDDTPDNLHLLSQLFKDEYRVKIAHNGEKALSICQSDTPPDLILLDIMMPGMDGFEVAQRLRGHPSSEHIPVIFVTAMTGEDARLKGMELGAVDFVTKPIDPVALTARVKNFMRYVELHSQLQADYDEMMQTERLKEDVERITRHDMKGPLSGVIGLVQSLADADNLTEDQKESIRMIEETALQVLDMINLSNELFKIETQRFVLKPQVVTVVQIIRRIAELLRRPFAVKNLTIAVATPHGVTDEELMAIGDSMLCYSLFQNLLKNACEAAPENSTVTITIHRGAPMKITLENQGVVPAAIRETFFEKFATADKQGGTGLGTYSAKLLVEAQNGSIAMETSDADNRTCITLTLPAQ
ncbi:ATP-binding response regulator [Sulfuritalea hydrogenivorans]|jgi:two-component system sensor histidine kinase/response regulator|uniref:histidine kinase n=1 Tax=Sulfuritalea hydrogenivorans sk43H TaxID=1223802 RepID=W0SG31_9PROT|nr:response regulator [Sulfuritalea hydrogenivorans]MDK9712599.1 response regulator [Sulfuritalea sp.]BAO29882.1 response regulator containing a CheY-like receiver domain and a GGDEF domain [Sulfuritalea hydrogenivorans sk43H]